MENNWDLIEHNEASKNANGGTELFMRFLYDGTIPRDLLEQCQIIPARIRDLKEDKIRILTLHNLAEDPESEVLKDPNYRNKFHKIVFISNWQQQQYLTYLGIPYTDQLVTIENGIKSFDNHKKPDDVINLVYASTPQRGLQILVPVFQKLAEEYPNIRLHVHSSFKIYGWDNADDQFEPLYNICKEHPQIEYHGFTPYDELRKKMENYHILAYPSIWPETACRTLIESMSAGMMCVHPNFAALWDTSGGLNFTYQGDSDITKHANIFYGQLKASIENMINNKEELEKYLAYVKNYADYRWSTNKAHFLWKKLLTELTMKYPNTESRKIASEMFIYRT